MPFKNALVQFLKLFNSDGSLAMRLGKFKNKDGNVGPIIQFYPESGLFNAAEILAYVAGGRDILSLTSPSMDGTWANIEIRSSDGGAPGYPHGSEVAIFADNVSIQALLAAAAHFHIQGDVDASGSIGAATLGASGAITAGGNLTAANYIASSGTITSGFMASATGFTATYQARRIGQMMQIYATITRTGATITAGATGDIGNTTMCTLNNAADYPLMVVGSTYGPSGPMATALIDTGGNITVTALAPNADWVTATARSFSFVYPLA